MGRTLEMQIVIFIFCAVLLALIETIVIVSIASSPSVKLDIAIPCRKYTIFRRFVGDPSDDRRIVVTSFLEKMKNARHLRNDDDDMRFLFYRQLWTNCASRWKRGHSFVDDLKRAFVKVSDRHSRQFDVLFACFVILAMEKSDPERELVMQFDRSFLRYRMQLAERALDEVAKNRTKLWLPDFQSVPLPHEFSLTRNVSFL